MSSENVFPVGVWDETNQIMIYRLQKKLPSVVHLSGIGVIDRNEGLEETVSSTETDPDEKLDFNEMKYWM